MDHKMKYVVFAEVDTGAERMYLFPETQEHREFASLMSKAWKPVRAGFAWAMEGYIRCFGESFSLGLSSDKELDTELLKRQFYNE